jgi:hypothetical protein
VSWQQVEGTFIAAETVVVGSWWCQALLRLALIGLLTPATLFLPLPLPLLLPLLLLLLSAGVW